MKLLERALATIDFGPSTPAVLDEATMLSRTFGTQAVLLHVLEEPADVPVDVLAEHARAKLSKIRLDLAARDVHVADVIIADGKPHQRIADEAVHRDVNVVLMGSGSRHPSDWFPLGLTTEQTVRLSAKPVWVVRPPGGAEPERLLCPVDFSRPSLRALKNAVHLARRFDGELHVLTVVDARRPGGATGEARDKARERVRRLLKSLDTHGVNVRLAVRDGVPHDEILTYSQVLRPGLILMGSAGSGRTEGRLGAVAEKVLRETPACIIALKSEDPIRPPEHGEGADLATSRREGEQLLSNGFPEAAIERFRNCLILDTGFAPAWEGIAAAHGRLGREAEAARFRTEAERLRSEPAEPGTRDAAAPHGAV